MKFSIVIYAILGVALMAVAFLETKPRKASSDEAAEISASRRPHQKVISFDEILH